MRAGTRTKDEAWVKMIWAARVAAIPTPAGLERWRAAKSLVADFKGLTDTAEFEKTAKDLGTSREVKDALKAERARQRREADLLAELGELAGGGSAARMKKLAGELRAKATAAEDSAERQMAKRVLSGFASSGREATRAMMENGDYAEAAELLEMLVEFRPGQSRTLYDLA